MDPIHPITPRPPAILPVGPSRVQSASRESPKESPRDPRDSFTKADEDEAPEGGREQPGGRRQPTPEEPHTTPGEESPPGHIDVRA